MTQNIEPCKETSTGSHLFRTQRLITWGSKNIDEPKCVHCGLFLSEVSKK